MDKQQSIFQMKIQEMKIHSGITAISYLSEKNLRIYLTTGFPKKSINKSFYSHERDNICLRMPINCKFSILFLLIFLLVSFPVNAATSGSYTAVDYSNYGDSSYNNGDYQQAISYYTSSLALNPLSANTYNSRGLCYDALGNYDSAVADYSEAIRLNPQDSILSSFADKYSASLE